MKNASTLLTFAASLAFIFVFFGQNHRIRANFGTVDGQQAASITAVTTATCPPCQKVKKHLRQLKSEGYMCVILDYKDYTGPEHIRVVPTLLYFDKNGKLLFKEEGYQTYEHIKSKLIPAYKIS